MNYKFSSNELKCLKLIASGTVIACSTPEESSEWNLAKKSVDELLHNLICDTRLRTVQNEQNLFAPVGDRKQKKASYHTSPGKANAYRALCMVERIRLLYSSLGFPFLRLSNKSPEKVNIKYGLLLLQWTVLYIQGKAEVIAKFQSVSMFNKVMNVEPLESIHLPFNWCVGSLTPWGMMNRKVIRPLIRHSLGERSRLAQCFLYFKKGCPKASESFIERTLEKHKQALTKPAPRVDTFYNGSMVVPRSAIRNRLRHIVYDVFKNYKETKKLWEPSRSSSFQKSKEQGGQTADVDFRAPGWGWSVRGKTVITNDKFGLPVLSREVIWVWSCLDGDNQEYFDTGYAAIAVPRIVFPETKLTKSIFARPVALTEPLKVRVITCESTWSTYFLAGAQKSLWDCLHKHHWFAFTGRPVVASDIPVCPDDKEYISVDYSAATDNLSSDFSRMVIQEICDLTGLPFDLCFDSLCNHRIMYKGEKLPPPIDEESDSGYSWDQVIQTNGQLMGSILSFIVLCICNAVVISLSVNPGSYDPWIPICVNGDDGLFMGGDMEYNIWKDLSSHVGLSPSIGKVYRSKDFCVIDSELFYKDLDGLVRTSPYPNASGMMQFDARSYSKAKTALDLKSSHSLWMSGFRNDDGTFNKRAKEAENLWYSTFSDILKSDWVQTYAIDYHLPQSLGGLGLAPRLGVEDRPVCREALARARWCLDNGLPWKRRPGTQLINGEDYVKQDLVNPFIEKSTWRKFVSSRPVSEETRLDLEFLGYTKPVDMIQYDPSFLELLLKAHKGGSSVSVSLLSGVDMLIASGVLVDSYIDFHRNFRDLRRNRSYQHYWENYREIKVGNLAYLNLIQGSRKLNTWSPSIPEFDPITDRNYSKMLEIVQEVRGDSRDPVLFKKITVVEEGVGGQPQNDVYEVLC